MKPLRILTILNLTSSFGRGVLNGIYRYARETTPMEVRVAESDEPRACEAIAEGQYEGVIAQVAMPWLREALLRQRRPVVNVSNRYPPGLFPEVISDDVEVGRAALQHFADLGHRRVGFYGVPGHHYARERGMGFRLAAAHAGVLCRTTPDGDDNAQQSAILRAFVAEMRSLQKPAAVFACNDVFARRVTGALQEAGLRVPQDIAVLGVDNDELVCESISPRLSSVVLACEAIGHEAAHVLLDLCAGRRAPARVTVRHRGIMTRESSGTLATADPEIQQAIEWIRQQLHRGIHPRDVLGQTLLSRRAFELRLKRSMGITPGELIRREQIGRAMALLATSVLPLKTVAAQCGFSDAKQFHKAFKRATTATPTAYRAFYALAAAGRAGSS